MNSARAGRKRLRVGRAARRGCMLQRTATPDAEELLALSGLAAEPACQRLGSSAAGLAPDEAERRLTSYGLNLATREHKPTIFEEIWNRAKTPLNALLVTLAAVSYFLGDARAAIVIALM